MRKFHELFAGRDDVYGTYELSSAPAEGKRTGRARTIQGPVTPELYERHIAGEESLGIVPIMKDNTCWFFAIDVDDYTTPDLHEKLARKIRTLQLPLLVFNTKSGGVHLYCFFSAPCDAKIARDAAEKYLSILSLPKTTEIFPKQESSSGSGNWINLPYFGDSRVCMGTSGTHRLTLREFLHQAHRMEIEPDEIAPREEAKEILPEVDAPKDHSQAPPCIQLLLAHGVQEGSRNDCMMHIGVYLKKAFPEDYPDKLAAMNFDGTLEAPLALKELSLLTSQVSRSNYGYFCQKQPMKSMCDAAKCKRMKYGISDEKGLGEGLNWSLDSLRQIGEEDPVYIAMVDGVEVRLNIEQLYSFAAFRKVATPKLRKILQPMKGSEWETLVNNLMQTMEYEDAPDVIGSAGMVIAAFKDWVEEMIDVRGGSEVDLAQGHPYYDWDQKRVVLRPEDFLSNIRRKYGRELQRRTIWSVLRNEGMEERPWGDKKIWLFPAPKPWFELDEPEGTI